MCGSFEVQLRSLFKTCAACITRLDLGAGENWIFPTGLKLVASHFTACSFSAVGRSFNTNDDDYNNIVMSCASVYLKEGAAPASQTS